MKDFSDDLLTRIFSVLGPADLLSVETVAARWRLCAVDELWRNSTIELWKNVIFNVPSEFGILQRVKRIPLALLKRLVARVDSSHCLEKNDYQKLLVCCLLFRFRERPHIRINGMTTRPKLPDWYQKIDNLKASYFFSARDIRRTTILASELCTISWVFHFKHNQDDEEGFVTKFNEDFTMISQMHSQKMNWQVRDHEFRPISSTYRTYYCRSFWICVSFVEDGLYKWSNTPLSRAIGDQTAPG